MCKKNDLLLVWGFLVNHITPWQFVSKSLSWGCLQFQSYRPHDIERQIAMGIPFSNTVKMLYPLIGYWEEDKKFMLIQNV